MKAAITSANHVIIAGVYRMSWKSCMGSEMEVYAVSFSYDSDLGLSKDAFFLPATYEYSQREPNLTSALFFLAFFQ
jgi:hypothetical protein